MPSLPQHDPLDVPATKDQVKEARREILQFPTAASDGKIFDFNRDSRELIEAGIRALKATGITTNWRLWDNTAVPVDAQTLEGYYNDLLTNQAVRGLTIDQEFVAMKDAPTTLRDIANWKKSHYPE